MQRPATLIYAHRGANREALENTRAAFERALAHAIDGMETDVQLSRDEVAVLWHDRFLNKLGLPDRRVDDFSYEELQALDAPGGLMALREFLAAYRDRCRLLVEIKNREWEEPARHQIKVRQTLDLAGPARGAAVLVSSFNLDSLLYARQYRPDFPLVYNLEPEQTLADVQRVLTRHPFLHGLCLPKERLDADMVGLLRGQGKCTAVYTCNSDEEIARALALGVDILISDVPEKALQMRQALSE